MILAVILYLFIYLTAEPPNCLQKAGGASKLSSKASRAFKFFSKVGSKVGGFASALGTSFRSIGLTISDPSG